MLFYENVHLTVGSSLFVLFNESTTSFIDNHKNIIADKMLYWIKK